MLTFAILVLVAACAAALIVGYRFVKTAEIPDSSMVLISLLVPLYAMKYRWVLWILVALPILGVLFFGFANSGTYQGYAAGSVFNPKTYEETVTTRVFGSDIGISAQALNKHVSELRSTNLALIILCVALLALVAALLLMLSWVLFDVLIGVGGVFTAEPDLEGFFIEKYELVNGKYVETGIEKEFPIKLGMFVAKYLFSDGWAAVEDKPEKFVELRVQLARTFNTTRGRIYLLFAGMPQLSH